ncbi:CPBP family glutamic-type intramembrane protease, partial [Kitasatospora sp. NPDC047058]|uniref:CPBP family glutamic-type intramembrane protease n=1 Tax=Kitasatospora sp. NPDC047058 TaxID=3155620 RepID=UPI0033E3DE9F
RPAGGGPMSTPGYAGLCVVVVGGWLALYRVPFNDPARRRRTALWLAGRTGLGPEAAFAVFGTVVYLVLGALALTALLAATPLSLHQLVGGRPTPTMALALLLAVLGTSSANILCVSLLYRAVPRVDVPGEIARVQWIASILALPRHYRWIIPAAAALFEEVLFRGAVLLGLGALGGGFGVALAVSTCLFAAGQVALVSTPVQAYVLGTSSVTLGVVGGLLTAATGGVLPALALHMSFAGFYTHLSASAGARTTPRRLPL